MEILQQFKGVNNSKIEWKVLKPNEHGDWLNQRSDLFSSFIPMGDKDDTKQTIFNIYSGGLLTSRNAWCYNFSKKLVAQNMMTTIDFYNQQREKYQNVTKGNKDVPVEKIVDIDQTKISWSRALKNNINLLNIYYFHNLYF